MSLVKSPTFKPRDCDECLLPFIPETSRHRKCDVCRTFASVIAKRRELAADRQMRAAFEARLAQVGQNKAR